MAGEQRDLIGRPGLTRPGRGSTGTVTLSSGGA